MPEASSPPVRRPPRRARVTPHERQQGRSQLHSLFGFLSASGFRSMNPSSIPLSVYDQMRNSPSVAAALAVVKRPIIGVDWVIECENETIRKFVEASLRRHWADFIRDTLTALEFGFSVLEKVYHRDPETGWYTWRRLLALDPLSVDLLIAPEDGSFVAVQQRVPVGEPVTIPSSDVFLYSHDEEFGNLYGRSRLRAAYQPWLYSMYMLQFAGTFYERYGMPTLVGIAPPGQSNFAGQDMPNVEYMQRLLDSLQQSSSVTLPHTPKEQKWRIEKLESQRTGGDYIAMLRWLEDQVMAGIMVPHLVLTGTSGGSYALVEQQVNLFTQAVDATIAELKLHIDRYLLEDLVRLNWGDKAPPCVWTYYPLSARNRTLLGQVLQALVQTGQSKLPLRWAAQQLKMLGAQVDMLEGVEEDLPKAEEPKPTEPTAQMTRVTLARAGLRREKFPWERRVAFQRVMERFDAEEAALLAALLEILHKQEEAFVEDLRRRWPDPKAIGTLAVKFGGAYDTALAEEVRTLFEQGVEDVREEVEAQAVVIPLEARQWRAAQSAALAKKHLGDVEFGAVQAALTALSQDVSEAEAARAVRQAFGDYGDRPLKSSVVRTVHKAYDEGRNWTADQLGIKYSIWSSLLDNRTCLFCLERDGMVVRVDDPDFARYAPGNVHANCRCLWVFTEERPVGASAWQTPTPSEVETYYG